MSFETFWFRKRRSNPGLNDAELKLTITVGSLRKQMESAYKAGHLDGLVDAATKPDQTGGFLDDLFKSMGR